MQGGPGFGPVWLMLLWRLCRPAATHCGPWPLRC